MNEKKLLRPWQCVQGIYVHIPFCVQKCLYCDFTSFACYDEAFKQSYAEAVCREIAECSKKLPAIAPQATIYFGGGTPSVLPVDLLAQITEALKKYGFWQNPAEATIEVNPGTANLVKLKKLRELGFDRISFGVQSLQDNELRAIGRIHTAVEALEAIRMAQEAGFDRINADLIYGLPGQTMESLHSTLQQLAATGIEHMSVYGLIVEEGTPLAALVDKGQIVLPDEDTCADMYEFVQSFLAQQGFKRYEISNYAKQNGQSRHNLVYWQYLPYAAFGAAACGFDGKVRKSVLSDVSKYVADALQGTFAYEEEQLSPAEQLSEFMFMNLRKTDGADLRAARERFGVDIYAKYEEQLKDFAARGLVEYDNCTEILKLTASGMELGNQVFEIFVTA